MHSKTLIAALVIAWPGLVLSSRLAAQDVTGTPLEWVEVGNALDQLPVAKHALRPDFPDDLRNTPDFGYVVSEFYVDEKGERLSNRYLATLPAYEIAVRDEARGWKIKPGLRGGKPINSFVSCTVIFNPASASVKKPDATARLLQVRLVVDPSLKPRIGEKAPAPDVVRATVSLDVDGRPIGVKEVSASLAELLGASLQRWRFAPARRGGQAIASEVRVPFILVPPQRVSADDRVPPKAIHRVMPDYPYALRHSGLRGEVVLEFEVTKDGRAINAFVARSLNPGFDQPAIEAIGRWKFEPARRDGVVVQAHMQITMTFEHPSDPDGGSSGFTIKNGGDQSQLPPEFQYDVAPKPRGSVLPVYPYELLRSEVEGKARVRFAVDVEGHVSFTRIDSADRPELGAALQAAVECYEFEPALKGGRPTQALLGMEQKFTNYDQDRVMAHIDRALLALEQRHPEEIVGLDRLDAKLKPTSTRPPVFPLALSVAGAKGSALVELLVDKDGQARLPRVVSASEPAFGFAAVQAVASWRFAPPRSQGKPVVTRVRVPFNFTGPPAAPKAP